MRANADNRQNPAQSAKLATLSAQTRKIDVLEPRAESCVRSHAVPLRIHSEVDEAWVPSHDDSVEVTKGRVHFTPLAARDRRVDRGRSTGGCWQVSHHDSGERA